MEFGNVLRAGYMRCTNFVAPQAGGITYIVCWLHFNKIETIISLFDIVYFFESIRRLFE
jgi:hypothetical protein